MIYYDIVILGMELFRLYLTIIMIVIKNLASYFHLKKNHYLKNDLMKKLTWKDTIST